MEHAAQVLGIPMSQVLRNIDEYGNTSAASIPLALAEAGFPLKIGEFPTHFDTFSIDSVFFNLQVVTSSN